MNPLVEKMLDKTVSNDTETRLLEDLFEHNVKCQTIHSETICSVEVVAISTSTCNGTTCLKCENSAAIAREVIASNLLCTTCGKLCRECWTIRPI